MNIQNKLIFYSFILGCIVLPVTTTAYASSMQHLSQPSAGIPSPLQGIQQQLCQTIAPQMIGKLNLLLQNAKNMYTQLITIENQAEDFYKSNAALIQKTIPNYDALVAQAKSSQNAVTISIQKVQTDIDNFSCSSSDPVGNIMQTKDDVTQLIQALIAYRQAVETLITAIQSVIPSLTPTPTI